MAVSFLVLLLFAILAAVVLVPLALKAARRRGEQHPTRPTKKAWTEKPFDRREPLRH